jgi:hypothetical protein
MHVFPSVFVRWEKIIAQKKGNEVIDSVVPLTPIGNFFQWNVLIRPVLFVDEIEKSPVCIFLI